MTLISLPLTLGLGTAADIPAQPVRGDLDSAEAIYTDVPVSFPGEMTWQGAPADLHAFF
ncbi:MAG: hypothetical protein WD490_09510 [Opitutales bacterium]